MERYFHPRSSSISLTVLIWAIHYTAIWSSMAMEPGNFPISRPQSKFHFLPLARASARLYWFILWLAGCIPSRPTVSFSGPSLETLETQNKQTNSRPRLSNNSLETTHCKCDYTCVFTHTISHFEWVCRIPKMPSVCLGLLKLRWTAGAF